MSHTIAAPLPASGTDLHVQLIKSALPIVLFTLNYEGRFTQIEGRGSAQMGLDSALGCFYTEVYAAEPGLILRLKHVLDEHTGRRWTAEVRSHTWEFHSSPLPLGPHGQPAGLIGIALNVTQQRQAEGEARWRSRETLALHSITAALTSTLEFSEVLAALEHQLAVHLNLRGGAIYLRETTGLDLYKAWGISPSIIERTSALVTASGFWSRASRTNPQTLDGLFTDASEQALPWRCALSIPLVCNHQRLGLLVLYGLEPLTFSKNRTVFFEMLGHQIGTALQNARMFREVTEGRQELRDLAHRLVTAQEAERAHIARELHDELGQILTSMKQSLELTERSLSAPNTAASELENAKLLVGDMLEHIKDMTLELRTTVLDDMGLAAALEWYFERFTAQTSISITFDHDQFAESLAPGRRFAEPIETAAYRIVQEALTNIVRHAQVEYARVALSLQETSSGFSLSVLVEDSGCGFDKNTVRGPANNGLVGMRERATALGGTLCVQSAPGCGTRIELLLPVEKAL